MGGRVAHEMAVQLRADGQDVALVIMGGYAPAPAPVDVSGTSGSSGAGAADREAAERLRRAMWERAGLDPDDPDTAAEADVLDEAPALHDLAGLPDHFRDAISEAEAEVRARIIANNTRVYVEHRPRVYDGDVLFLSSDELEDGWGRTMWQPYTSGRISEARLPCTHDEMADPPMLPLLWNAVAAWLSTTGGDPQETPPTTSGETDRSDG
jgi:thioesterase domain-containing protein